ncbi:MAG: hypothetical protein KGS72_13465 [Cyanobacteria bacterium REEB67]|nr:hypothetical protein [Cyanobacteria bacterium REEB67]
MTELRHHAQSGQDNQAQHEALAGTPALYSVVDIKAAREFTADAEKLLGKLDIDHKPGLARQEILQAENSRHLSAHDKQVLAGLNNLTPSVQEAWQVPGHRAHLRDAAQAADYRWEADGRKKYDADYAARLNKEAAKIETKSNRQLKIDGQKQVDAYFNGGAVTEQKLSALKQEVARVEVARHVVFHPADAAAKLLERLHCGKTLSAEVVAKNLSDSGSHGTLSKCSPADKVLLSAISAAQLRLKNDALLDGEFSGKKPDSHALEKATTLNAVQLADVIKKWAIGEARADHGNHEQLFFHAIEGYQGRGLVIKSEKELRSALEIKNAEQFNLDLRVFQNTHPPLLLDQ